MTPGTHAISSLSDIGGRAVSDVVPFDDGLIAVGWTGHGQKVDADAWIGKQATETTRFRYFQA